MYAIIETSGRQYRVEEGATLYTLRQNGYDEGDEITFDRVLLVRDDEGARIGTPYLDGARVMGRVEQHFRDKKELIVKFRPRKSYDRVKGHRQWLTKVTVQKIDY